MTFRSGHLLNAKKYSRATCSSSEAGNNSLIHTKPSGTTIRFGRARKISFTARAR